MRQSAQNITCEFLPCFPPPPPHSHDRCDPLNKQPEMLSFNLTQPLTGLCAHVLRDNVDYFGAWSVPAGSVHPDKLPTPFWGSSHLRSLQARVQCPPCSAAQGKGFASMCLSAQCPRGTGLRPGEAGPICWVLRRAGAKGSHSYWWVVVCKCFGVEVH